MPQHANLERLPLAEISAQHLNKTANSSSMSHTLPSISMTIPAFKNDAAATSLPPIGHDISRPPSTSTASERRGSPLQEHRERVTLPSLSTLTKVVAEGESSQSHVSASAAQHAPTYSNASPTPTSVAGQGNMPPVCQNCQTSTTPLWRRDEAGSVLCNACGLFLKLHGRPRPISLKTDVIKSRNRVKSSTQNGRRKMQFTTHQPLPPHHDLSTPPPHPSYRRVSDQHMPIYPDRSASPISRAGTPSSLHPHHTYPGHPHTAPPLSHHLFDPSLARSPSPMPPAVSHHTQTQSAPSTIAGHRGASPHPHAPTLPLPVPTVNGHAHTPPVHHPQPVPSTAELQTRISELEVINAIYKGQVQDMETARRRDAETIEHLRRENDELRRRNLAATVTPHSRPATMEPSIGHQIPPPPPEPRTEESVNYATATGSMKRRRGRTLERVGEDSKQFGSKRRETGEFPRPELPTLRV